MTCYGVRYGYYSKDLNPATGKRSIVFDPRKSLSGVPIMIPCGECVGCRMAWRREWAIRCMHERRLHRESAFLTLTYEDKFLPELGSLRLKDLQLFMKRLRLVRPAGLRFFGCGEYGTLLQRPHYHVLLFNADFGDRRFYKNAPSGAQLFRSKELSQLWPAGNADIGNVDFQSCCYVAGYVTKKIGEPVDYGDKEPEFRVMSRRPGIGAAWFDEFHPEAYRHDSAIMDGHEVPLPRYYDDRYAKVYPASRNCLHSVDRLSVVKRERKRAAVELVEPKARMLVREQFELKKLEFWQGGR